jgi:hypothetical protein
MAIQSNPLTRPFSPWVIKADLDDVRDDVVGVYQLMCR